MSGSLGALPQWIDGPGRRLAVRQLASDGEARACAELMASSEPWRSLGRDVESPNVFILSSSFNPRARALYERLG